MARRSSTSFHSRFNIEVDRKTVETNFVNRILNLISSSYPYLKRVSTFQHNARRDPQLLAVANCLGVQYKDETNFSDYIRGDFLRCLMALEAIYSTLEQYDASEFTKQLDSIISQSEADLGVRWKNGNFLPSGAKLLDEALVNANLDWLSAPRYHNVLTPFQKGLSEFLQGKRDSNKFIDAVRDMYEAFEAMANVITGKKSKDLSANRELFVSKLGLSPYYAKMLSDYIDYACKFRHALEVGSPRTPPPLQEAEAFIYITGLFLRLALQSTT